MKRISQFLSTCAFSLACSSLGCDQTPADPGPAQEHVEANVIRPITLTPHALLIEQDAHFQSVEVFPDRLIFHFNGDPVVAPQMGNVVSGVSGGGYLRWLTDVVHNADGSWTAPTEVAELGDLILDGEFEVRMDSGADSFQVPGLATQPLDLDWNVIANPMDRCHFDHPDQLVRMAPRLLIDRNIVHTEFHVDFRVSVRRERPSWLSAVGGVVGGPVGSVAAGLVGAPIPHGEFRSADFIFATDMEASLELQAGGAVSGTCDLIPNADAASLMWVSPPVQIGPVPVMFTTRLQPSADLSLSLETPATGLRLGASGHVRAGVQYRRGGWNRVWERDLRPSASLTEARVGSSCRAATLEATLQTGVSFSLRVYDAVGPTVTYGPRFTGTVSADFPRYAWSAEVNAELAGSAGAALTVPYIDAEIASVSLELPAFGRRSSEAHGRLVGCGDAGPIDAGAPDARPDAFVGPDAFTCRATRASCTNNMQCCGVCRTPGSLPCPAGATNCTCR